MLLILLLLLILTMFLSAPCTYIPSLVTSPSAVSFPVYCLSVFTHVSALVAAPAPAQLFP